MFSLAFLWRFKPEYRDILPITNEEEEPELEPEPLTTQSSIDLQRQGPDQASQIPTDIAEEKEKIEKGNEGKGSERSICIIGTVAELKVHMEGGLKAIKEFLEGEITTARTDDRWVTCDSHRVAVVGFAMDTYNDRFDSDGEGSQRGKIDIM